MSDDRYFLFDTKTLALPLGMVIVMWLVYWAEFRFFMDFGFMGIRPRRIEGIAGIFLGPLKHGNFTHLWGNSLPVLLLGTALTYFYRRNSYMIFLFGWLLTGLMTWLIAVRGSHIGASGVVYFLASFLFFKGLWTKHYRLVSISFIVAFIYGGLVWYTLPIKAGMSWEGHLSGAITGLLVSILWKTKQPKKRKYVWETRSYDEAKDPFMRHFDQDGNFIENLDEEE